MTKMRGGFLEMSDDEDDYIIPTIPWAPHIKAISI